MSWPGGKEISENGEAVLLFAPASTGSSSSHDDEHGPSSSSIGGIPAYFAKDEDRVMQCIRDGSGGVVDASSQSKAPQCQRCRLPMLLVAQVNAPVDCQALDRSLYVFGCNRAECWREATRDAAATNDNSATSHGFIVGGGGVVRCVRSQEFCMVKTASDGNPAATRNRINQPNNSSGWGFAGDESDNASDNDWGADDWGEASNSSKEDGMDDLEAMLTACEIKSKSAKPKGKKNASKNIGGGGKDGKAQLQVNNSAFPRFLLGMYDEPYAHGSAVYHNSDIDDDEDAIGTAEASDDKIQKMLSRYLEDEDDQDIVQALGGAASPITTSTPAGSSGSDGGGEKDERLKPEERAFLTFTDRIKRSPEQVLRYAYGGVPMWSVPTHDEKGMQLPKSRGGSLNSFPLIKPCACGRERTFELEVLPSVLFALNVDVHAKAHPHSSSPGTSRHTSASSSEGVSIERKMNNGGMDWGALAVYSCPDSCDLSREEFVVAQSSVDGTPTRREFTSISAAEGLATGEEG